MSSGAGVVYFFYSIWVFRNDLDIPNINEPSKVKSQKNLDNSEKDLVLSSEGGEKNRGVLIFTSHEQSHHVMSVTRGLRVNHGAYMDYGRTASALESESSWGRFSNEIDPISDMVEDESIDWKAPSIH